MSGQPVIGGRPPIYSKALADAFLERVEKGERIKVICTTDGMPSWPTVQSWIRKNPTFAARYAHTRASSAEALEHEAIEESYGATDKDSAAAARIRVDTLKWAAAKRNPRLYADKMLHTGADGEGPIQHKLALDYGRFNPQQKAQFLALLEIAMGPQDGGAPVIEGEVEDGSGE